MKKCVINRFGVAFLVMLVALGMAFSPVQGEAASAAANENLLRRSRPKYIDKYLLGNADSYYPKISGVYYLTNNGNATNIDLHAVDRGYTIRNEYYYPEGSHVRCIIMYTYGGPVETINVLL